MSFESVVMMVINKQIHNCKIVTSVSEFSCDIIARILLCKALESAFQSINGFPQNKDT
jgi:hypothetical protein